MWIGFIRHGVAGASLVWIVFVLPACVIVLCVSAFYVAYHGLSLVQAVFYGIRPAVMAIAGLSALQLARSTIQRDKRLWVIFGVVGLVTVFVRAEMALLFILAGIAGILLYSKPDSTAAASGFPFLPPAIPAATLPLLLDPGAFFTIAGVSPSAAAWPWCLSCTRGSCSSIIG